MNIDLKDKKFHEALWKACCDAQDDHDMTEEDREALVKLGGRAFSIDCALSKREKIENIESVW